MIEGLEERLVLSTILWDSVNQPAGGSWDTASNWVGGQIPQSTDDAVIDLTGPGTITLDAGATNDVNSLTTNANTSISIVNDTLSLATASSMGGGLVQSGGTLTGPGTLTVTGLTTWTGGTMSGSGITNANGGMTIGDAGSSDQMFLDQRTLNNAGTATIADEAYYYPYGLLLSSGATVDNEPGATFDFITDASIDDGGGSPDGGAFINEGTLSKTGGAGSSVINAAFTGGGGSVDVQTGTLSLVGGSLGGTFSITADAGTFSLDGSVVLEDGLNVTGTGVLGLTGGTTTLDGAATLSNFAQSGGTFTGPGTLTVTGLTTWTGGTMSGSGITNANGGMTIGDAGLYDQMFLDQRTLNNAGTATIADEASYYPYGLLLSSGATVDNEPGATFDFITDASIGDGGGSPDGGAFINEGTLSKTGGTGSSAINAAFTGGGGSVDVQTGTLSLVGGSLGGTFSITADAGTFSLDGSVVLEDGLNVTGTGALGLTGGTTTLDGAATLSNFAQSGGTFTGPGTLTVTGLTTWTGGTMSGSGITNANGGMTVGDAGLYDQMFLDQRTLNNAGTATIADEASYYPYGLLLSSGATVDNEPGATFDFTTDASIGDGGGSPDGGALINEGTLSKTGGAGSSVINAAFTGGGGSVDVQTGSLSLVGGSLGGTFSITADAGTFSLDGSVVLEDGLNVTGTGALGLTGRTTTLNGTATLSNFAQSGGTFTGPGTLTVTGLTTWTGGTMSGSGITNANGGMAIGDAGLYDQMFLDQRTLNNAGTATIADEASYYPYGLLLSSGATVDNEPGATFDFIADASIGDGGGSPDGGAFINEGTLSKTGGTGASTIASGITLNNTGTLNAATGGTLAIAATINNTGSVFSATGVGTVAITGTVDGGTIDASAGTNINLAGSTLDGVTLTGDYQLTGNIVIEDGLTLNGTLTLGDGSSSNFGLLIFDGSQTLDGTGLVDRQTRARTTRWDSPAARSPSARE